jgi:eukaryotic-like serine/threonine-protein kinase
MLAPGSRLGPYVVESLLGQGGMGEVYRARDTRLHRTVAIKVLPSHLADDARFRERFEREARAASALNHVNILSVFDVGREANIDYLVTELLDGVTLRERIKGGALPPREVVNVGAQIADGLAAAHAAGLLHRDLKPDNVMVTREGRVKILDFGLAKPSGDAVAGDQTRTEISQAGVLVGTIGYTSPEQVRGQPADARSDLFSLGVLLYEIGTGRRAFSRPTTIETLNAILREDAPDAPETVPAGLRQIISHCLEREPAQRFQSAQDLAFALRSFGATTTISRQSDSHAAKHTEPQQRTRVYGAAALALIGLLLVGGTLWVQSKKRPESDRIIQLEVSAPVEGTFPDIPQFALSPDGSSLLFVATVESVPYLWLRRFDSPQVQKLTDTQGAAFPFWSPDGQHVAFFSGGLLKTTKPGSGVVQTICQAANGRGGTWSRQGEILFASAGGGLSSVRALPGATARAVTHLDRETEETAHVHPVMLPEGEQFLFVVRSRRPGGTGVFVGSTTGRVRRRLLDIDSQVAHVPGYLVYSREIGSAHLRSQSPWRNALVTRASLLAQRFDAHSLALSGDPVKLLDEVRYSGPMSAPAFSVSPAGVLAYQPPDIPAKTQLQWVDRSGKSLSIIQDNSFYPHPRLSRDGSHLALSILDPEHGTPDVWAIELIRGTRTRITYDPGVDFDAVWSPDGRKLAFASDRGGTHEIYVADRDSPGKADQLTSLGGYNYPTDWSPDGRYVLYQGTSTRGYGVFAVPASGGQPIEISDGPFGDSGAEISPDGKWVAFNSHSTPNRSDVYVQSFPKGDRRYQISSNGGTNPKWSKGGQEVVFLSDDDTQLLSARLKGTANLSLENPKVVMNLRLWTGPPRPLTHYDVVSTGDRFVVDVMVRPPTRAPLRILFGGLGSLIQ